MALSDLSNIKEVLISVVERLNRYREIYERNETAVREQIVLPVLRGLGWNTENPEAVHPEDRTDSGSPDYTLKVDLKPVVTIEVKKLGVDVTQPGALEQAHRYASASGIALCMATNGTVWVLARSFEVGRDLRGRIIWQVLLSNDTVDEVAQKLTLIAKENIGDIDSFIQFQDELDEKWEELLAEPGELVVVVVKLLRDRLSASPERLPYPRFIDDYVDQRIREIIESDTQADDMTQPKVTGQEGAVTTSVRRGSVAEILIEAAERAIREGRLLRDTQIQTGYARFLVSRTPVHKNGKNFFSPRQLSNGLYIETHCSLSTARNHARLLDNFKAALGGPRARGR